MVKLVSGRKRVASKGDFLARKLGEIAINAYTNLGVNAMAKCPNCGNPRFKEAQNLERIPNNIVLTKQVKVGECPKSGCGKLVIYAA